MFDADTMLWAQSRRSNGSSGVGSGRRAGADWATHQPGGLCQVLSRGYRFIRASTHRQLGRKVSTRYMRGLVLPMMNFFEMNPEGFEHIDRK
jgi:hypothetical protein